MSAPAFTPGPWHVAYTEVHGMRYGIRGIVSAAKDEEGNPVLREITGSHCKSWTEYVVRPEGADADEADFRLIALAPELYEYVNSSAENGCATAHALIAKARGDQ